MAKFCFTVGCYGHRNQQWTNTWPPNQAIASNREEQLDCPNQDITYKSAQKLYHPDQAISSNINQRRDHRWPLRMFNFCVPFCHLWLDLGGQVLYPLVLLWRLGSEAWGSGWLENYLKLRSGKCLLDPWVLSEVQFGSKLRPGSEEWDLEDSKINENWDLERS